MKKHVYKIDTLKINLEESSYEKRLTRSRTWGIFHDLKEAQTASLENWTDMCEMNYYNFLLVSEMPEGICVRPLRQWWYKATYEKGENEPKISLFHESITRDDKKKDPLNNNDSSHGWSFFGW